MNEIMSKRSPDGAHRNPAFLRTAKSARFAALHLGYELRTLVLSMIAPLFCSQRVARVKRSETRGQPIN
jgi:hypothetical protein